MATIETKFPNGVVFAARGPSIAEWDRYIAKALKGEREVGRRELIQLCATSHSTEETAGLLARYPGAIKELSDSLDQIGQGDLFEREDWPETGDEISVDFRDQTVLFRVPTGDEWSSFQSQLSEAKTNGGAVFRDWVKGLANQEGVASAMFEAWPSSVQIISDRIGKLIGLGIKVTIKKG